jgi:valyl-tRNA synthetase
MPFVTEEIWGYLPDRQKLLVASNFPTPDRSLLDTASALSVEIAIQQVRQVRRWRDLAGVPAGTVLEARIGDAVSEFVPRLARLATTTDGDAALTTIGPIEILPSDTIDPEQVRARIEERRGKLRAEIERAESKLSNEGFVGKAPEDVVAAERDKLASYRAELEDLG